MIILAKVSDILPINVCTVKVPVVNVINVFWESRLTQNVKKYVSSSACICIKILSHGSTNLL